MGALRDRVAQLSLAVAEREDMAIGTESRLVMTKGGLVDALARACRLTKEVSESVVTAVFERITEALVKGERVDLRGFGTVAIRHRPARVGRNPRTGATVSLPARKVPFFKAGKELRTRISA